MSKIPAITVVMPAHNTEKYIGAAIKSILNQTFQDFELWVLENGSTDQTAEIAEKFTDARVRVFKLGKIGFQGALSFALENAKSDWIARMDSDDICVPTRFEEQMRVLSKESDYVMVGSAYAILTPFGHIIERLKGVKSRELDKKSVALGGHTSNRPRGRVCADPSMIFSRKVAIEVGGYDSEFTMGDVPLWLRMLEGRKGWEISKPLYMYRLRPTSFSTTHNEGVKVRKKYAPDLLNDFLEFCYGATDQVEQNGKSQSNFWRHSGFLELLAGDKEAALKSAGMLEKAGNKRSARVLKIRAYMGKLGQEYYKKKYASSYRHRPDLENELKGVI